MKKILEMKSVFETVIWVLFLTVMLLLWLRIDYDQIDAYNKAVHNFQWVSNLEDDARYVRKMGNSSEYYISVSSEHGDGVIDRNGKEIIAMDYETVDYKGGAYIAATTMYNWMLFDVKGNEAASFNRIRLPYAYAGDRYFIQYGNDSVEDIDDGFAIIDAVSGETVREYEDFYNAVRLDDGNWYISKTLDIDGVAGRRILNQRNQYESTTITIYDEETEEVKYTEAAPYGFFTDENFEPLFDEKTYRLICQGDGLYVARVVEKGSYGEANDTDQAKDYADKGAVVVLDEKSTLCTVEDESVLKRLRYYEKNSDLVTDATTIFRAKDGNIGFKSLKTDGETLYLDKAGNPVEAEQYETTETGIEMTKAEIHKLLSSVFSEAEQLPGTDNVLVNGELGCGIIRWRGGKP